MGIASCKPTPLLSVSPISSGFAKHKKMCSSIQEFSLWTNQDHYLDCSHKYYYKRSYNYRSKTLLIELLIEVCKRWNFFLFEYWWSSVAQGFLYLNWAHLMTHITKVNIYISGVHLLSSIGVKKYHRTRHKCKQSNMIDKYTLTRTGWRKHILSDLSIWRHILSDVVILSLIILQESRHRWAHTISFIVGSLILMKTFSTYGDRYFPIGKCFRSYQVHEEYY